MRMVIKHNAVCPTGYGSIASRVLGAMQTNCIYEYSIVYSTIVYGIIGIIVQYNVYTVYSTLYNTCTVYTAYRTCIVLMYS